MTDSSPPSKELKGLQISGGIDHDWGDDHGEMAFDQPLNLATVDAIAAKHENVADPNAKPPPKPTLAPAPVQIPARRPARDYVQEHGPNFPRSPPYKCYIGNLDYRCEERDVLLLLQHYKIFEDRIKDMYLARDRETNKFKGFCYVEFFDPDDLAQMLSANSDFFDDRQLRVDIASDPRRSSRSRSDYGREPHRDAIPPSRDAIPPSRDGWGRGSNSPRPDYGRDSPRRFQSGDARVGADIRGFQDGFPGPKGNRFDDRRGDGRRQYTDRRDSGGRRHHDDHRVRTPVDIGIQPEALERAAQERPKLKLLKKGESVTSSKQVLEAKTAKQKSNPFGDAKPREENLKIRSPKISAAGEASPKRDASASNPDVPVSKRNTIAPKPAVSSPKCDIKPEVQPSPKTLVPSTGRTKSKPNNAKRPEPFQQKRATTRKNKNRKESIKKTSLRPHKKQMPQVGKPKPPKVRNENVFDVLSIADE